MTQKNIAIVAAVVLIATALFLVFLGESLTAQQFFGVRLVLSLAAAGIVAVLPGFMKITMSLWTNVGVRGGGAVGVFILLMYFNPPFIESLRPGPKVQTVGFLSNLRDHLNERVPHDEFVLVFKDGHEALADFVIEPAIGGSTFGEVLAKICGRYTCLSCDPEPSVDTKKVTLSIRNGPLVATKDSTNLKNKKLTCPE